MPSLRPYTAQMRTVAPLKLSAAVLGAALAASLAACSITTQGAGTPVRGNGSAAATSLPGNGSADGIIGAAQFVEQATAATQRAQTVKFRESLSLLGASVTATGAARFGGSRADASVSAQTPVGPVHVVVIGGDVYVKGLGPGEPGRPWVKNTGESQQVAAALQKADPRQTLEMLSGLGTLRPAGHETVNGVPATKYSVTIDLAKVAKRHPGLAAALDVLIRQGITTQDLQVWVDAQKRPLRMTMTIHLPDNSTSVETVDYYDWGQPVSITAPPASQVTGR